VEKQLTDKVQAFYTAVGNYIVTVLEKVKYYYGAESKRLRNLSIVYPNVESTEDQWRYWVDLYAGMPIFKGKVDRLANEQHIFSVRRAAMTKLF
jgi:hypothetical protein